jgi:hypothetical protein
MTIKIPDYNFLSPEQINQHTCLASSRFLNSVPEQVSITSICQDSYNTSLIIVNFTLVGTFSFTPTLKILEVDGDTSYTTNNIVAPLAVGHYRNSATPINTNCSTFFGTLVFDIGSRINNYLSANTIVFELVMDGSIPQAYGVSFPNQSCSSVYTWFKGVLPKPTRLTYDEGNLGILFEYNGQVNCNCNISCTIPSGVSQNILFCPGESQTVTVYQDPTSTDPYNISIQLSDSLGNISSLEFQSLAYTKPKHPNVAIGTKPKRAEITIFKQSENGVAVENGVMYRVLKYHGNKENTTIWKDWSDIDWNHFIDYDIIPGQRYGYCVLFKGKFGETSLQSEWTEITV